MTDEEKQKLYEAIGYQETPIITEYPKEVNLNIFTVCKMIRMTQK